MKKIINVICGCIILVFLSIYPIYAIVVWTTSKSPSSFSEFPNSGVWISETNDYSITFDFTNKNGDNLKQINAYIIFNKQKYNLVVSGSHGHGSPLYPCQPSFTLYISCNDNNCKINFCTSKYKINENDFILLDIYVFENNCLKNFVNKMDIKFIKIS